jgi:Uma2 family endonuclease
VYAMSERVLPPRITLPEWLGMGTEDRFEVVRGELVVSPSPTMRHQDVLFELVAIFRDALADRGLKVRGDIDWHLGHHPDLEVRRPDVVVVPRETSGAYLSVAPLLAVEILSPGHRGVDLVDKPAEYGAAGLGYYWVIDTDDPVTVIEYGLDSGTLVERRRVSGTDVFEVTEPFRVGFRPSDLLG